jgi:hypothetical protein
MSTVVRPIEPERLRHHQGERLLARDLHDQSAFDDQLRWWHNRALHDAYGVVEGLTVRPVDGAADPAVVVDPGLAIDAFGRELILGEPRQLATPATADRSCIVIAAGAAMGDVSIHYVPVQDLTARSGVPLAFPPKLQRPVPRARPVARPRIGRGATIAGQTPWQPWTEGVGKNVVYLGIEAAIDTSAAGFTSVPCYFVQIAGAMATPSSRLPLLPFGHVTAATNDGFVYRLLMPWLYLMLRRQERGRAVGSDLRKIFRGAAGPGALSLSWIGLQSVNSSSLRAPLHRIEVHR